MNLLSIFQQRHSIRKYTGAPIDDAALTQIIQAGLLSASSRSIRPWEFIVVKDKDMLRHLSECRTGAAWMLAGADAAIVVIANAEVSDVWIEDSSIAMANMHLMADSLGIGSCWIQGRLRTATSADSGTASITTEDYVRECLHFPEGYKLEAILSLGMPAEEKTPPNFQSFHLRKFIMRNFKILHCLRNLPPTRLYEYITIPATGSFLRTHGDSEYKTERYLHRTALFFIFNINRSIILLFFIYSPIFCCLFLLILHIFFQNLRCSSACFHARSALIILFRSDRRLFQIFALLQPKKFPAN